MNNVRVAALLRELAQELDPIAQVTEEKVRAYRAQYNCTFVTAREAVREAVLAEKQLEEQHHGL